MGALDLATPVPAAAPTDLPCDRVRPTRKEKEAAPPSSSQAARASSGSAAVGEREGGCGGGVRRSARAAHEGATLMLRVNIRRAYHIYH
jgi:hypothetical protein